MKGTDTSIAYIHSDQVAQPQKLTDNTGAIAWDRVATPFGETASLTAGGGVDLALRFPGQQIDAGTGLAYNYFRDYDSSLGRYLQSDPIGLMGGLNPYAYANGNPISYFDPDGRIAILVPILVGAAAGAGSDLAIQLWKNGGNFSCVDWGDVAFAAGLGGAMGPLGEALLGTRLAGAAGRLMIQATNKALGRAVSPAIRTAEESGLEGANFAQRYFSSMFSKGGKFAGQSVEDVAGAIRSGTLSPSDIPVQYIIRDGKTLILNTRSAQALEQAGIPRGAWNAVNMTGDATAEARLTLQLLRNELTSDGIPTVMPGK